MYVYIQFGVQGQRIAQFDAKNVWPESINGAYHVQSVYIAIKTLNLKFTRKMEMYTKCGYGIQLTEPNKSASFVSNAIRGRKMAVDI